MAVREIGGRYYVYFTWKKHRIETVTSAKTVAEAKRIEKDVKSALRVYSFDNLDQPALEFVIKTFENKSWALPTELARLEPEEELTLIRTVKDFLQADPKHQAERNIYAIDRLVEHFGESRPLKDIKVPQIKEYQRARQKKVENATVNRELAVLSGIMRVQGEHEALDFNPCLLVKSLPTNQRDSYLSWEDYVRLLENSWWMHDIMVMLYYTGMRFKEVASLRWEMYKPDRRVLILPSEVTKEGKNPNKGRLRPKRVPLRREVVDVLETRRRCDGDNVVNAVGLIFGYSGRFKNHCGTYQGKPIDRSMVRKCWARAIGLAGISGLQIRDFRHTWKTNAQRSGIDPAVRNLIVGHSGQRSVEDRYIRISDQELLRAVDAMTFDHGWTELDLVEEG
ncbi:MAG: tyrosine-type recombinase/integrase [Desulfomonilaceae bacterium]